MGSWWFFWFCFFISSGFVYYFVGFVFVFLFVLWCLSVLKMVVVVGWLFWVLVSGCWLGMGVEMLVVLGMCFLDSILCFWVWGLFVFFGGFLWVMDLEVFFWEGFMCLCSIVFFYFIFVVFFFEFFFFWCFWFLGLFLFKVLVLILLLILWFWVSVFVFFSLCI